MLGHKTYKNPNRSPRAYWAEAQYPLEVPSQGPLYLAHIIPNNVPSRTVQWAHSAIRPVKVQHFLAQKEAGERIRMGKPGGGASREMIPHAGLEARWREPRTTGEVLDALWGYLAVSFTLRPWNWTGITVYRVLDEEQYFWG